MEPETPEEALPAKRSKRSLVLGLVLALVGGGAGFWAVQSGKLNTGQSTSGGQPAVVEIAAMPDVVFIPLDKILVSLSGTTSARHLQFRAQLEVPSQFRSEVEMLKPRVVDVLNSYLRALEPRDIEASSALVVIRAHILRRIQMVLGPGKINDLLVMEFVLS